MTLHELSLILAHFAVEGSRVSVTNYRAKAHQEQAIDLLIQAKSHFQTAGRIEDEVRKSA